MVVREAFRDVSSDSSYAASSSNLRPRILGSSVGVRDENDNVDDTIPKIYLYSISFTVLLCCLLCIGGAIGIAIGVYKVLDKHRPPSNNTLTVDIVHSYNPESIVSIFVQEKMLHKI